MLWAGGTKFDGLQAKGMEPKTGTLSVWESLLAKCPSIRTRIKKRVKRVV